MEQNIDGIEKFDRESIDGQYLSLLRPSVLTILLKGKIFDCLAPDQKLCYTVYKTSVSYVILCFHGKYELWDTN